MSLQSRLAELFWPNVRRVRGGAYLCWEWTGPASNANGDHPVGAIWDGNQYVTTANRAALVVVEGRRRIPEAPVFHTCGNPLCVNPRHLEVRDRRRAA